MEKAGGAFLLLAFVALFAMGWKIIPIIFLAAVVLAILAFFVKLFGG